MYSTDFYKYFDRSSLQRPAAMLSAKLNLPEFIPDVGTAGVFRQILNELAEYLYQPRGIDI
jgi:hypothetical protein